MWATHERMAATTPTVDTAPARRWVRGKLGAGAVGDVPGRESWAWKKGAEAGREGRRCVLQKV